MPMHKDLSVRLLCLHLDLSQIGLFSHNLRRTGQPRATRARGQSTGRSADDHHGRRELPGLPRGDPRPRTHGADAPAGAALRRRAEVRARDRRGPLQATVPPHGGERRLHGRHADRRHRRGGASSRSGLRVGADGLWSVHLRDVRRILLQRQGDRGRRWWRQRDGGGDLLDQVRIQGHGHPPA